MTVVDKEFVFTHVIKDVSNLKKGELNTSEIKKFCGIPWQLHLYRSSKVDECEIELGCEHSNENEEWSIDTDCNFKIGSVPGNEVKVDKKHIFEQNDRWCESNKINNWNTVTNDNSVNGDLLIEVHVKINKVTGIELEKKKLINFDESMKKFSDVILIVDGQKFHVSKLFLASKSTYFEALFMRDFDESKQSEIILNDIKAEDFQNFLQLIYGEPLIEDENVDGILHLADMYDAPLAVQKCEQFIIHKSLESLKKKLEMAKQYNMEKLRNSCLFKINTVEDILSVYSPHEMDPFVLDALLQKSLTLHNSK